MYGESKELAATPLPQIAVLVHNNGSLNKPIT
jgi:hypothetical protein